MIRLEEISPIGIFGKTHGIKGEINLELNIDFDLEDTPYIIVDIDGIFVPFFIEDYRYKSDSVALVLFEDINTEERIRPFFGKKAYVKKEALGEDENDERIVILVAAGTVLENDDVVGLVLAVAQAVLLSKVHQVIADGLCIAGAMGNGADLLEIFKDSGRLQARQFHFIHINNSFIEG